MKRLSGLLVLIMLVCSQGQAGECIFNIGAWEHARIAQNFTAKEFRCPCCGVSKVNGKLLYALELLRIELGCKKIHINSGYRCPSHNRKVGGAKRSKHMYGLAADVHVDGVSQNKVAKAAKRCGFTYIKTYRSWVHVDVR